MSNSPQSDPLDLTGKSGVSYAALHRELRRLEEGLVLAGSDFASSIQHRIAALEQVKREDDADVGRGLGSTLGDFVLQEFWEIPKARAILEAARARAEAGPAIQAEAREISKQITAAVDKAGESAQEAADSATRAIKVAWLAVVLSGIGAAAETVSCVRGFLSGDPGSPKHIEAAPALRGCDCSGPDRPRSRPTRRRLRRSHCPLAERLLRRPRFRRSMLHQFSPHGPIRRRTR